MANMQKYGLADLTLNNCQQVLNKLKGDATYGNSPTGEGGLLERVLGYFKPDGLFPERYCDDEFSAMVIALIDVTNSTQIHKQKSKENLAKMSQRISSIKNIKKRIAKGDKELVEEIANKKGKPPYFFSFATKYCYYINKFVYGKNDYMKYDSKNAEILPFYFEEYLGSQPKNKSSYPKAIGYGYQNYIDLVDELLKVTGIDRVQNKYELLDAFIWYKNRNKKFDTNKNQWI